MLGHCSSFRVLLVMQTNRCALLLAALALLLLAVQQCKAEVFTRALGINCALRYVDVNPRDGKITPAEIDVARNKYLKLPWYVPKVLADLLKPTSVIMSDCDFDRDGGISRRDMDLSNATCLGEQKLLDKFKQYFCDKAAEIENQRH